MTTGEPNSLQKWIRKSRAEARLVPKRYLSGYPDLVFDEHHVWMTEETHATIVRNCGTYDGGLPTTKLCGKMFLSRGQLMWFGIDKEDPMNSIAINSRIILIKGPGLGPARMSV